MKSIDWKRYEPPDPNIHYKNRTIATILALLGGAIFLSGIGHIYVERLKKAILFLSLSTVLRILTLVAALMLFDSIISINDIRLLDNPINLFRTLSTSIFAILLAIFLSVYIVIWAWQVYDVRKETTDFNNKIDDVITEIKK